MLHYQTSSNDLKQKGTRKKQEQHEELLCVTLHQEEQVYFPVPAGQQFKS